MNSRWKKSILFKFLLSQCALWIGLWKVLRFYLRRICGEALPNSSEVCLTKIYRGGLPSRLGWGILKKKGVKTIIQLTYKRARSLKSSLEGMDLCHFPIMPFGTLDEELLLSVLKVMTDVHLQPVFIHCFHGADRTGFFVALYRMVVEEWTAQEAISEMKRHGAHFWHQHLWKTLEEINVQRLRLLLKTSNALF